ncbi:MAG: globin [Planctomycetota bacterium]
MTVPQAQCFHDSYARCRAQPHFLPRFYERFLGKGERIASRFEGVDMERQQRMLRASLELVILAATSGIDPGYFLAQMARRHARNQYNIPPALYADWLGALLETAAECDPSFDEEAHQVWVDVMSIGIRYMISQYGAQD